MNENRSGCSAVVVAIVIVAIGAMIIFKGLFKWILIGLGVMAVGIVVFIIVLNQKERKKKQELVADGMTLADVERIIKQSNKQLQEIRRNYYKLKDPEMQKELDMISNLFRQIFKIVNEDPKDIKAARRYINTTFSSLSTIVNQSVKLFEAPNLSEQGRKSLENAHEGMKMIRKATEHQMDKFYENNILDLDVELSVLKKSLSSRGLLDNDSDGSEDEDSRKEQV